MPIDFYMDRSANYQVGGQYLNVDFSRLPASRQADLFKALNDPGTPANLAVISKARADFVGAFQQVSGMGTLPAPTLGADHGPWPMGGDVALLIAYLTQKNFQLAQDLSAKAGEMKVASTHKGMELADKEKAEREKAADFKMASGVVSGVLNAATGATGLYMASRAGVDCKTHRGEITDVNIEKKKLDTVKEQSDRSVQNLHDQAQANRGKGKELDDYVKEVNSKDGLSADSRKKLDDEIADKKAQMDQCDADKTELQKAIDHKSTASKDASKSEAERKQLKEELFQLENNKKELEAKQTRLQEDKEALEAVGGMQDTRKQFEENKLEIERLQKEMSTDTTLTESQKRAKQYKVERLEGEMKTLTKEHVDHGVVIDKHKQKLNDEAQRMDETAKALQKAWRTDIGDRQAAYDAKNNALQEKLENANNKSRNTSALIPAASSAIQAPSSTIQYQADLSDAEATHVDKEAGYQSNFGEALGKFAGDFGDMANKTGDFWKEYDQNNNDVYSNIARNI